jgi:hypothetical protein
MGDESLGEAEKNALLHWFAVWATADLETVPDDVIQRLCGQVAPQLGHQPPATQAPMALQPMPLSEVARFAHEAASQHGIAALRDEVGLELARAVMANPHDAGLLSLSPRKVVYQSKSDMERKSRRSFRNSVRGSRLSVGSRKSSSSFSEASSRAGSMSESKKPVRKSRTSLALQMEREKERMAAKSTDEANIRISVVGPDGSRESWHSGGSIATPSERDDSVTRRVELPKETAPDTKDDATLGQEPMKPVLPAVVAEEAASSRGLSPMSPMFETFSKVYLPDGGATGGRTKGAKQPKRPKLRGVRVWRPVGERPRVISEPLGRGVMPRG